MSEVIPSEFREPSNIVDAARMEVAREDIARVSAAGWRICHYQGWSGHNFVGAKPGIRIRGEKHHDDVLALQHLLNRLLAYDEEHPTVQPLLEGPS